MDKKWITAIILVGIIVYANSLLNAFVFDDLGQIVQNPAVHSLSRLPAILLNHTDSQLISNYYRPIPLIIYTLIYSFANTNSFFYHFIQLVFHSANSVLVYYIFKKYFSHRLSFFISLLFLVHPINQITVAYIANLQDVLFMFFGLISFYLLQNSIKRKNVYLYVSIYLLLSLLSKESGVLFIVISSLYLYLFDKKKLLLHLSGLSVVSLVYLCLRIISKTPFYKDPLIPIMKLPFADRLINLPAIIFYYLKTFIFPKDLTALHSWVISKANFSNFIFPLALDLVFIFTVLIFVLHHKGMEKKLGIFFFTWFLIGLGFHLHLVPIDMTVSDHYFYFPLVGLLGLMGLFINQLRIRNYTLGVLLIFILSLITINRNTDWKDQTRLLSHDQRFSAGDYLQELLYGNDLYNQGKYDQAQSHIQTAITLYPDSWKAYSSLGAVYYQKGDIDHAKTAFLHSMSLNNYYAAYENLGLLMITHEETDSASAFLLKATALFPNSDKLWFYRIIVESKLGNYQEALLSAKSYYLLKNDRTSQIIYSRLLQGLPVNIELK